MRINHNIASINTHNQLSANTSMQAKSLEKLSSGLRINRAGDDAAGLAISEKMRGQIRGLDQSQRNSQDAISLIQTAEGSLNETQNILQRMRELAVQAGNDTNVQADRDEIQKEINQLTSEINRIGNTTEFNTRKLLDGSSGNKQGIYAVTLAGADVASGQTVTIDSVVFTANSGATGGYSGTSFAATGSATGLAAAINNHSTLGAKYTATVSGTAVVLTQKEGQESATAPTLSGTSGTLSTNTTGASNQLTMQIGANGGQTFIVAVNDMRANSTALAVSSTTSGGSETASTGKVATFKTSMDVSNGTDATGIQYALDVGSASKATAAIDVINDAITSVSAERSKLGAYQNRLEHTISNLGTASENLTAAESRIRDVDMAKEMIGFTKNNILSQAAQAMLSQANQQSQGVLQLLR